VGSTSVPGLQAKPTIDVVLVVADSADERAYLPALKGGGYSLRIREPDWFEHRMLTTRKPRVNLHIFSAGCEEVDRMILFRDWLRNEPADRELYERTKRALSAKRWHIRRTTLGRRWLSSRTSWPELQSVTLNRCLRRPPPSTTVAVRPKRSLRAVVARLRPQSAAGRRTAANCPECPSAPCCRARRTEAPSRPRGPSRSRTPGPRRPLLEPRSEPRC